MLSLESGSGGFLFLQFPQVLLHNLCCTLNLDHVEDYLKDKK
jgi:hypothetical protein